jgi:hypothetical protein
MESTDKFQHFDHVVSDGVMNVDYIDRIPTAIFWSVLPTGSKSDRMVCFSELQPDAAVFCSPS